MHNIPKTVLSYISVYMHYIQLWNISIITFVPIKEFWFEIAFASAAHSLLPVLLTWNLISRLLWSEEMLQDWHSEILRKFNTEVFWLVIRKSDFIVPSCARRKMLQWKFMPAQQCQGPGQGGGLPRWQQSSGRGQQGKAASPIPLWGMES